MNTYQYNIAGEISFTRGETRWQAYLKVYFGELKRIGKCNLKPQDLKQVSNPEDARRETKDTRGNLITNQLRHL
jgi:hypothetical protein